MRNENAEMRNRNLQEDCTISDEELMAISEKLIKKHFKAYAALAGFPEEPDEDETSNL